MENQENKFVCASCGSESSETPGSCCGEERKEKSKGSAEKCENCGAPAKQDGTADCGCK